VSPPSSFRVRLPLYASFQEILEPAAFKWAFPSTTGGVAGGATHVTALLTAAEEVVTEKSVKLSKERKTYPRFLLLGWRRQPTPLPSPQPLAPPPLSIFASPCAAATAAHVDDDDDDDLSRGLRLTSRTRVVRRPPSLT
jgi:hypothetical protein